MFIIRTQTKCLLLPSSFFQPPAPERFACVLGEDSLCAAHNPWCSLISCCFIHYHAGSFSFATRLTETVVAAAASSQIERERHTHTETECLCVWASVFVRVFLFSFSHKSVLSRRLFWLIRHSRRASPHYGQLKRRFRCHREAVRVWGASQRVQRQKQGESCTDILKTPKKEKVWRWNLLLWYM